MNQNSRVLQSRSNQITSRFGRRTITYTSGPAKGQTVTKDHNGIDVVGQGSTLDTIVAHTGGVVQYAGYDDACGYFVRIRTDPGPLMVYYHMAKGTLAVKTGDRVERGAPLGFMGATGNVTGAHLHFGIQVDGKWIDPEPWLNADCPAVGGTAGEKRVDVSVPVVRRGSSGAAVAALQKLLDVPGGADGKFGANTQRAVEAFQKRAGLTVDGVCGRDTWTAVLNG